MILKIPTQLIWNGVPFGFLKGLGTFLPVQAFSLRAGVKIEADHETGRSKVTGHELQECSITIRAMNVDRIDPKMSANPRLVYEALCKLKGISGPLYASAGTEATLTDALLAALQTSDWRQLLSLDFAKSLATSLLFGTQLGGVNFMLTAVEMEATDVHPNGEIWKADITLTLVEDAAQRQTGGLRVYVNDVDITEQISVHGCIYETHAEGQADTLEITFADTKKQWANWKPSDQKDIVRIEDGSLDSGDMFISRVEPQDGVYKLSAASVPKTMFAVKSRVFSSMSLPALAAKIAGDNKLECKTYSVPEVTMPYIAQQGESDAAFLHRICASSGCSFLVFNGDLCVYSQAAIEGREPSKTLTLAMGESCNIASDAQAAYQAVELRNGTYTGTASDPDITTGKVYREAVTASWASAADANAAAAARLRQLNKNTRRAELDMCTQRQLAAGSVVRILSTSWAGSAFIYRARHDLLAKRSKLWVRKPIT